MARLVAPRLGRPRMGDGGPPPPPRTRQPTERTRYPATTSGGCQMKQQSEMTRAFGIAIASALITLLSAVLPQVDDRISNAWVFAIGYSVILLSTHGLLVNLGATYVRQYRELVNRLEDDLLLRSSVPTMVRFRSRIDRLTVASDGSGTLKWFFEIERGACRQNLASLELPVFFEEVTNLGDLVAGRLAESAPNFPVQIVEVVADGQDRTDEVELTLDEVRSSIGTHRCFEYGRISVPVRWTDQRPRTTLEITMHINRLSFPGSDRVDGSLVVDVPYVTDVLRVEIEHESSNDSIAPLLSSKQQSNFRPVVATSALMPLQDQVETEAESGRLATDAGRLVWATDSPKVGYRYEIHYRSISHDRTSGNKPIETQQSSDAASGTAPGN